MSANLDLVRSIYAAWEQSDYRSGAWQDPQIEYVIADGPSPGRWTGQAVAEGYREVLSAWEDFRLGAEVYRELDNERVLVLVRFGGRGKTSGLDLGKMRAKGATVFHVRDGKVTRLASYFDRKRALADLGLASGGSRGRVNVHAERITELLRCWFEAFNARDIEAAIALCDPSGVFISAFAVGGAAVYDGHDGMRRYFGDLAEAWGDDIRLEPEAYFDLGEHTLAFSVSRGRGRQSGAEVAMPVASVARWSDGLLEGVRPQAGGA